MTHNTIDQIDFDWVNIITTVCPFVNYKFNSMKYAKKVEQIKKQFYSKHKN